MTGTGAAVATTRPAEVQRRTVRTLVVSQACGGLGMSIGIAVTALLAEQVSGREELAGLAQTMQVLGAAGASFLLARVMGLRGRRIGLALGYLLGAAGALLCVVAGVVSSFPLLLVATLLLGSATAANNQSRYAATDLAAPKRRARDLSLVVWATTIGAVAGPNLVGATGRAGVAVGLPGVTGPFLFGGIGIAVAAVVVLLGLRPDPLLLAQEQARLLAQERVEVRDRDRRAAALAPGHAGGEPPLVAEVAVPTGKAWSRVVAAFRTRPGVAAGVVALALAHSVMVSVMVMTPLRMHHGGASLEVIGVVISVHVLGMFAFAPLVGWAVDRAGRPAVLSAGAVVLFLALFLAGTAPGGASLGIGAGLFLLGLGWSLCTVSASTLLSESAPEHVRTDVQGAADLVMNLAAAAAGALAGLVVGTLGFPVLTGFAAVLAAGIVTAAEYARRSARQPDSHDPLAL